MAKAEKIDGKFAHQLNTRNGMQTVFLKDSLQDIASKLEERGYEIEIWNFGDFFEAYLGGDLEEGKGITIEGREVFRHNGTDENVNIDLNVYKWNSESGCRQGREEKNIRFRMNASENIKNKRIDAIIDRYMRFR